MAVSRAKIVDEKKSLILKKSELRTNTAALFTAIENDEKLKAKFIEDPAGVLSQRVFKSKLPAAQASEANRLLFAILQNDRFVKWIGDYTEQTRGRKVSRDEFARDFSGALLQYGDETIVTAVMRSAIAGFAVPGGEAAQQFLYNNAAGQWAVTPVNQPSTSDQTLKSSQNFNGIGFGTDAISPVAMRSIMEQLVNHAKILAQQGVLTKGRL